MDRNKEIRIKINYISGKVFILDEWICMLILFHYK